MAGDNFLSGSVGQAVGSAQVAALLLPVPKTLVSATYIVSGQSATDFTGSLWSIDASGNVYRDGRKVSGTVTKASKIAIAGKSVFAFVPAPAWWQWNGSGWTGPIIDGDPNILK